jgi:hypothetical protein
VTAWPGPHAATTVWVSLSHCSKGSGSLSRSSRTSHRDWPGTSLLLVRTSFVGRLWCPCRASPWACAQRLTVQTPGGPGEPGYKSERATSGVDRAGPPLPARLEGQGSLALARAELLARLAHHRDGPLLLRLPDGRGNHAVWRRTPYWGHRSGGLGLSPADSDFCRGPNPARLLTLPPGWCCSFGPHADGPLEEARGFRARAFLAEL